MESLVVLNVGMPPVSLESLTYVFADKQLRDGRNLSYKGREKLTYTLVVRGFWAT